MLHPLTLSPSLSPSLSLPLSLFVSRPFSLISRYWEDDSEEAKAFDSAGGLFRVGSDQLGGVVGAPVGHFAA